MGLTAIVQPAVDVDERPACPACGTPLDLALTRAGHGIHPTCVMPETTPDGLATELFTLVADRINRAPRSLQTAPGPSELGTPCDRRLGYKLAGTTPVNDRGTAWKPFVGTAIHEQLADVFTRAERAASDAGTAPRWHVEERVNVGEIDGTEIHGSCDLYDSWTGTVWDWKTVARNKIREHYRPHGPGAQYRAQAHLYGRGWVRAGLPVNTVGIIFFTRDGEFTDRHVWSEPYNEQVAVDALERAGSIARALAALGPEFTIPTLPTADAYCAFCPYYSKNTPNVATGCPGHVSNKAPMTLAGPSILASI